MSDLSPNSSHKPISWEMARCILRDLLLEYMQAGIVRPSRSEPDGSIAGVKTNGSILHRCVDNNIDLYAGALLLSVALMILSCICNAERNNGLGTEPLRPGADSRIYRSQVAAACLLLAGSLLSLWMVHRRRSLTERGGEDAKRREITSFLKHLDQHSAKQSGSLDRPGESLRLPDRVDNSHEPSGTALHGLYPVYRRMTEHDDSVASWKRIPSLLLVKGDYVALQIGDIVPALCESLDGNYCFATGERLSLASFETSSAAVIGSLPRGRTTFSHLSPHLLTMCNGMTIFRVAGSPLLEFLRTQCKASLLPQVARKITAVRVALWGIAPVLLIATAIIVFSRPRQTSGDFTLLLPLPFLAALGVLPVVGPAFAFFLEIVGTARILVSVHPHAIAQEDQNKVESRPSLLVRYIVATGLSRMSLWDATRSLRRLFRSRENRTRRRSKLVRVPPASINLLEKLGVCTAFTLIDDELACEPHAVPQQLLIPSGNGLRLLDLCPAYDEDESQKAEGLERAESRNRGRSFDSDSDSDDIDHATFQTSLRKKVVCRPRLRHHTAKHEESPSDGSKTDETDDSSYEVQFEDPLWWQQLPSLKCIGLSCLLVDRTRDISEVRAERTAVSRDDASVELARDQNAGAKISLVNLLSAERCSNQLTLLADCIGFSSEPSDNGDRGDISTFFERQRLHTLSTSLFRERLELDSHERSSEQSRWWGLIRPDATSVIVQDSRNSAFQLFTVGDPQVISDLCNEAWQGEISTILPLAATDRRTILDTSRNWKLADLDVAAFSYAPVPHTLEGRIQSSGSPGQVYLLDNAETALSKDKNASDEWSIVRNQIFLGLLGSLVVPRREIQGLLGSLSDAGVRFVYFSPRNMRRQKELATQMGIDVAWNCAISLRPLKSGEEDPHRMVSNYADWDVNAKLPHGVEDVRMHLKEVDNVPVLVSLFTDVTKETTKEMVEIFQAYNDTVISVGLSHLPGNAEIFDAADIAVSIDILSEMGEHFVSMDNDYVEESLASNHVLPVELEFVSSIASHACAFRFRGATALSHLSNIIEQGRAAFEAAYASALFVLSGCLSFSLFVFLSACLPSTTIPFVPVLGAVLYLQVVLPCMGLAIAFSAVPRNAMTEVPPKNDQNLAFYRNEGYQLYRMILAKALLPALLSQLYHMIVFGEAVLALEPDLVAGLCEGATGWVDVVRCRGMENYSGPARTISGAMVLAIFALTILCCSLSFVRRHRLIVDELPWECNQMWCGVFILLTILVIVYASVTSGELRGADLPWYLYLLVLVQIVLCLLWNEQCKRIEIRHERRAEKLRRLQFETRLGAWSPK